MGASIFYSKLHPSGLDDRNDGLPKQGGKMCRNLSSSMTLSLYGIALDNITCKSERVKHKEERDSSHEDEGEVRMKILSTSCHIPSCTRRCILTFVLKAQRFQGCNLQTWPIRRGKSHSTNNSYRLGLQYMQQQHEQL